MVILVLTPKGQSMWRISLLRVNIKTMRTNKALKMEKKNTALSLSSFRPRVMTAWKIMMQYIECCGNTCSNVTNLLSVIFVNGVKIFFDQIFPELNFWSR